MGKQLDNFFRAEAKRLRREADAMERKGGVGYENIIRIYRKDAEAMEQEAGA